MVIHFPGLIGTAARGCRAFAMAVEIDHPAYYGVTTRNGKIVRQEASERPLVANNSPIPRQYLALSS